MLTRRSFLPLLAAPAVLKLGVYMPVSSAKLVVPETTWVFTAASNDVPALRYGVLYDGDPYWFDYAKGGVLTVIEDYVSPFGAVKVPFNRFSLSSSPSSEPSTA